MAFAHQSRWLTGPVLRCRSSSGGAYELQSWIAPRLRSCSWGHAVTTLRSARAACDSSGSRHGHAGQPAVGTAAHGRPQETLSLSVNSRGITIMTTRLERG
jgi:hypothetical protein